MEETVELPKVISQLKFSRKKYYITYVLQVGKFHIVQLFSST